MMLQGGGLPWPAENCVDVWRAERAEAQVGPVGGPGEHDISPTQAAGLEEATEWEGPVVEVWARLARTPAPGPAPPTPNMVCWW